MKNCTVFVSFPFALKYLRWLAILIQYREVPTCSGYRIGVLHNHGVIAQLCSVPYRTTRYSSRKPCSVAILEYQIPSQTAQQFPRSDVRIPWWYRANTPPSVLYHFSTHIGPEGGPGIHRCQIYCVSILSYVIPPTHLTRPFLLCCPAFVRPLPNAALLTPRRLCNGTDPWAWNTNAGARIVAHPRRDYPRRFRSSHDRGTYLRIPHGLFQQRTRHGITQARYTIRWVYAYFCEADYCILVSVGDCSHWSRWDFWCGYEAKAPRMKRKINSAEFSRSSVDVELALRLEACCPGKVQFVPNVWQLLLFLRVGTNVEVIMPFFFCHLSFPSLSLFPITCWDLSWNKLENLQNGLGTP